MKSSLVTIAVAVFLFWDIEPSDLRAQEGRFGRARVLQGTFGATLSDAKNSEIGLTLTEPGERDNSPKKWTERNARRIVAMEGVDAGDYRVKWDRLPTIPVNPKDFNTDFYRVFVHVNGENNVGYTLDFGLHGKSGSVQYYDNYIESNRLMYVNNDKLPALKYSRDQAKTGKYDTIEGSPLVLKGEVNLIVEVTQWRGNLRWGTRPPDLRTKWGEVECYYCPLEVIDVGSEAITLRVFTLDEREDGKQPILSLRLPK